MASFTITENYDDESISFADKIGVWHSYDPMEIEQYKLNEAS